MAKLWLLVMEGPRRKARERAPNADHAVVSGPCPGCGESKPYDCAAGDLEGFRVQGTGRRIADDDRAYEADAVSVCCNRRVGVLRLETNTLFGVREDEAVSRLGVRIY